MPTKLLWTRFPAGQERVVFIKMSGHGLSDVSMFFFHEKQQNSASRKTVSHFEDHLIYPLRTLDDKYNSRNWDSDKSSYSPQGLPPS